MKFKNIIIKLISNKRARFSIPYLLIALFFIVTPFMFLLFQAFHPASKNISNWAPIKDITTWKIMWRSIWTGLLTAFIVLVISFPFSYIVGTSKNKTFKIFSISLMVSPIFIFTISKIFAIKGMMRMGFSEEALNSYWFMIIGMVYLNLPFMIIPLYSVFNDMPKNIINASNDLGCNWFITTFKVVIPYALKAILSGFALVFILSSTNISISTKLMFNHDSYRMIGNQIYSKAQQYHKAIALAKAATLSLVTIVVMSMVYIAIYIIPTIVKRIKKVYSA